MWVYNVCVSLCVYEFMCVYICICMCIWLYVCMYIWVVCACVYMYTYMCVCICRHVYVLCVCVWLYDSMCISKYMCVWVCIHLYLCMISHKWNIASNALSSLTILCKYYNQTKQLPNFVWIVKRKTKCFISHEIMNFIMQISQNHCTTSWSSQYSFALLGKKMWPKV